MLSDLLVRLFAAFAVLVICAVALMVLIYRKQNQDIERHYEDPQWVPQSICDAAVWRENFKKIKAHVGTTVQHTVATLRRGGRGAPERQKQSTPRKHTSAQSP